MYASEINHLLRNHTHYKGCYAWDKIPSLDKFSYIIVNSKKSSETYGHWRVVGRHPFESDGKNVFEVFDPLGTTKEEIHAFSVVCKWKPTDVILFNKTPVQDSLMLTCGKGSLRQTCVGPSFKASYNKGNVLFYL